MTTFERGDRVVVESPVYMPETSGPHEFRDPADVTVGSTGTIVRGAPDWDGDVLVDVDGYGTAYIATEGLLLVDDLDTLAAERATTSIKVGDRVVIERAIWRTSGAGLQDHADYGESDRPEVGDEFVVGRFSDSPNIVGPHVSSPDGWLLSAEGLRKVDPEPEAPFKVGDRVIVANPAAWRMSSGGTAREGLSGEAPHTGTVVGFGLYSPDNVSVALDNDSMYDAASPLAALPESLTLIEEPDPTPAPLRIDVRFYIGDVDVTAHIASALKEAA